jgi:hypothetical protein
MTKEELDTDIINIVCKHIRADLGQLVITLTRGSVKACLNDMGSLTRTQLNDIFRISHDIIHEYDSTEFSQFGDTDKIQFRDFARHVLMFYCSRFYLSHGQLDIPTVCLE